MPSIRLARPPRTDNELWLVIVALWGVKLPRRKVCKDHVSPFDAVAHAYFARDPNFAVWYASRGSGKSLALAVLGLTKTFVAGADCTILGGSIWQSQNVRDHMRKMLQFKNAPAFAVKRDITTMIETTSGNVIKPLPASQTSVRGPHPPLQLLDEIDEMDYDLYQAALGQAMEQLNERGEVIGEYIVASSTWQNPIGCVLKGTKIITARGELPIQDVQVGDLVPTRSGWKPVTQVHDTGRQECVTVTFRSGRKLICTPWHPVWTRQSGFVRADALTPGALGLVCGLPVPLGVGGLGLDGHDRGALPAPPASASAPLLVPVPEDGLLGADVVPADADFLPVPAQTGPVVVDCLDDGLEMSRVDAGAVPAGNPTGTSPVGVVTEMIKMQAVGDGANGSFVDPSVRQSALPDAAVSTLADAPRPVDAAVGVRDVQDGQLSGPVAPTFSDDEVEHVAHHHTVLPTFDLTVGGQPEYVANGIVVHNTMTTVIEDARKKGLPVFTWCWRELLAENGGWMSRRFIENKRRHVSEVMWKTEYELNEPASSSRAIDLEAVERYFVDYPKPIREEHTASGDDDIWVWEDPISTASYAAGADWAKEKDKTVITVIRTDTAPRRLVALRRMNRKKYPVMTRAFVNWVQKYNAVSQHDKTGVGNALNDFLPDEIARGFVMVGRPRAQMFSNYIADFEHGGYQLPRSAHDFYKGHRGATVADVFAPHAWDEHPPDDLVAMGMAHRAAGRTPPPGEMPDMQRDENPRKVDKRFHEMPDTVRVEGVVSIVDNRYDTPASVAGDELAELMSVGPGFGGGNSPWW